LLVDKKLGYIRTPPDKMKSDRNGNVCARQLNHKIGQNNPILLIRCNPKAAKHEVRSRLLLILLGNSITNYIQCQAKFQKSQ
jgi:hypothetical protein